MQLRWYQEKMKRDNYQAWQQGATNLLDVLPTGAGKTFIFSSTMADFKGEPTCAIAHRQELVGQISLALARCEVPHKIIGPDDVVKMAVRSHMRNLGKCWYDPNSRTAVAGVDTIIRRTRQLESWGKTVKLWVQDEAHHLTQKSKWGKAVAMFPNARGLGVTATPGRLDGYGLGRHTDGVMDKMVFGPSMQDLINEGYLTPYRIFGVFSNIDVSHVALAKDGDFNRHQLKIQVRKSRIVGDVVEHYLKYAPGKLGITFATDVETAGDLAQAYTAAGIPAEVVTAQTPGRIREDIFQRFAARHLLQVVNVDILGEGFDCPAVEVVSFARPTQSYNLYRQQFGRGLRPMPGNPDKVAIILDHVGNVMRHMLPTYEPAWTLERRERSARKDVGIPVRVCPKCTGVYESIYRQCPYCGWIPVPVNRSRPEFVDGDLTEMSPELLAALSGEIQRINSPANAVGEKLHSAGYSAAAAGGAVKQHKARLEAQMLLRDRIALWAGYQRAMSRPDSEIYRRFYHTFGYDILTAQTLGRPDAEALAGRVEGEIKRYDAN